MQSLKNKVKEFSKKKLHSAIPFITKKGLDMFGYKLVKNEDFNELEWDASAIIDASERAKKYILKGDKDMAIAYIDAILGHAKGINIIIKGHS